jgi:transposase
MDLGDKYSHVAVLRQDGTIVEELSLRTSREHIGRYFRNLRGRMRVVLEAGTHSPWISALLEECGHEVVVANPQRAGAFLATNGRKHDKLDARTLAQLGFYMLSLLRPLKHRSQAAQQDLAVIRARAAAIRCRTVLVNAARSLVKVQGYRLPSCSASSFARAVAGHVPAELRDALEPLLKQIAELTTTIKEYDKKVSTLCAKYPETEILRQIDGVGPLTAVTFILTLEDPERFAKSRQVGAFVGLVPRQCDSGDRSPQLRITKAGDSYLRQILISAAHYILGPFGPDCNLRRHGEMLMARGGKRAKKQAVVATARKLAILMHRLWRTGETYEPFYRRTSRTSRRRAKAARASA